MAAYTDIFIDQGSAYTATIPVFATNGVPLNLAAYAGRGQIRKSYTSSTAVDFDVQIVDAENGQVRIRLTPQQTAGMKPGRYVFDIEIYTPALPENDVIRISEGQVTITPRVTRP